MHIVCACLSTYAIAYKRQCGECGTKEDNSWKLVLSSLHVSSRIELRLLKLVATALIHWSISLTSRDQFLQWVRLYMNSRKLGHKYTN